MSALVEGKPIPQPGPAFEIVRLKAGATLEGFILSPRLWGYHTHWIKRGKGGFSVECKKGVASCPCDEEELPTRWKGYLHVYDCRRQRECFLELTPFVGEQIDRENRERGHFRGLKFKATRSKGADNGRLEIVMFPYNSVPENLPEPKDPRPYLERLWSLVGKAQPKDNAA